MSKQDKDNETYSQGYHDARNESNPIARLSNSIHKDFTLDESCEIYKKGYDKGLEDRSNHGPQSDDSSSDSSSGDTKEDSKGSGCYLTTACVSFAGLSDDCDELQMMRRLRDDYVAHLADGPVRIKEYYDVAPKLLNQIAVSTKQEAIFNDMLTDIRSISQMVRNGELEMAYKAYEVMTTKMHSVLNED
jgi:hypothetical protein